MTGAKTSKIKNNWKEFKPRKDIRAFQNGDEPEIIYIIPTGEVNEDDYIVTQDDGWGINTGKTEVLRGEEIEKKYGISLNEKPKEEAKLIGYLNKEFGYNGFEPIKEGSEVYELSDKYFFKMITLNGEKEVIQKFYKETLKDCINFL